MSNTSHQMSDHYFKKKYCRRQHQKLRFKNVDETRIHFILLKKQTKII